MHKQALALALLACSCTPKPPAKPPAPRLPPPVPSVLAECATQPSIFDQKPSDWLKDPVPPMACEPAPGRAGWVTDTMPPPKVPQPVIPPPVQPPAHVVLAVTGASGKAAHTELLRAISAAGTDSVRAFIVDPTTGPATTAALEQALADMAGVAGFKGHLAVYLHGVRADSPPFGCLALADGCYPLTTLHDRLRALPARSRVVVLDGVPGPEPAVLFADGATGVVALRDGPNRAAGSRQFFSTNLQGPSGLTGGTLRARALRALAAAGDRSVLLFEPTGTLTWTGRVEATSPAEAAIIKDLPGIEAVARKLAPGQRLLVYLQDRDCDPCKLRRKGFVALSETYHDLRFAVVHDATPLISQLGARMSPIDPAVAYFDHQGNHLGNADDPQRPIAGLALAELAGRDARRVLYDQWLLGKDLERVKLSAEGLLALDGGSEEALLKLIRRVHRDSEPELVLAVMSVLIRQGYRAANAAPEALSHIDHPDDRVRLAVVDALFAIQATPETVLCPAISAIPDPSPLVREQIRKLLFGLLRQTGPGIHAMNKLLTHPSPAVRRTAVEAFAELNAGTVAAPALPYLVGLLHPDEPLEVRKLALLAILRINTAAAPAIHDLAQYLVDDPEPSIRALTAAALGSIGPAAHCARDGLELLARDDVPEVQKAARQALIRIDGPVPSDE